MKAAYTMTPADCRGMLIILHADWGLLLEYANLSIDHS